MAVDFEARPLIVAGPRTCVSHDSKKDILYVCAKGTQSTQLDSGFASPRPDVVLGHACLNDIRPAHEAVGLNPAYRHVTKLHSDPALGWYMS